MTFENLNLIPPILKALQAEGYVEPTPIQSQTIPLALNKQDVLGCAQTGTGKTAAFAIPIIQLLATQKKPYVDKRPIKSLVLTPTRELAIQIGQSFESYGQNTNLKYKVIFGGVSAHSQIESLRTGVDVLIATPGRLLDLMQQNYVDLSTVQFFVLDEADRMLDMGFINDVKKILTKLPAKKQSLFFSATIPPAITQLADTILVNPAKVEVTPVSSTANTISQTVYFVDKPNKKHLLVEILKDAKIERVLVFTRTKHGADRVAQDLEKAGIRSQAIHGNKSQNNRQKALINFKSKVTRVLVATDIAARGIDIDELTHVVNFELPNVPESYVHRIGRTGRAGASGIAIAFCDVDEKEFLADIEKLIGKTIPVVHEHNFPMKNHTATPATPKPQRPPGNNRNGNSTNKATAPERTPQPHTSSQRNSFGRPTNPNNRPPLAARSNFNHKSYNQTRRTGSR